MPIRTAIIPNRTTSIVFSSLIRFMLPPLGGLMMNELVAERSVGCLAYGGVRLNGWELRLGEVR
jgi:hypothetical protein